MAGNGIGDKVLGEHFARPFAVPGSFAGFYDSLPRLLGADSLRGVVDAAVALGLVTETLVRGAGAACARCRASSAASKSCCQGTSAGREGMERDSFTLPEPRYFRAPRSSTR